MGTTVFSPSLPPLSCKITITLLPGGTLSTLSKAFRNCGTINDAVASDPICKNSLRLISMYKRLTQLILWRTHDLQRRRFDKTFHATYVGICRYHVSSASFFCSQQ